MVGGRGFKLIWKFNLAGSGRAICEASTRIGARILFPLSGEKQPFTYTRRLLLERATQQG